MTEVSSRVLTIPNAISFVRIGLIPVFLVLLLIGEDVLALIALATSSLTDFLDGYLARRLGQVTRLGQLLDPAADRLCIFAVLIGLTVREIIPWFVLVVILARELMLVVIGVVLSRRGRGPLPVHRLGKVGTFALLLGLPTLVLGAAVPSTAIVANPLGWGVMVVGIVVYWAAGVLYLLEMLRIVRGTPKLGVSTPEVSDSLDH